VDLLVDLLLLRRLRPLQVNIGKRLVKAPKIYVRDSGLLHALLRITDYNALAGHPVVGASWEGFIIENLLAVAPTGTLASYYRTAAGAEIDLVLDFPGLSETWAIEIKSGLSAKPSKGFYYAIRDIQPDQSFLVYAGETRYPLSHGVEAISIAEIMAILLHKIG